MLIAYIMAWFNAKYPKPQHASIAVYQASGITDVVADDLLRQHMRAVEWLQLNDIEELEEAQRWDDYSDYINDGGWSTDAQLDLHTEFQAHDTIVDRIFDWNTRHDLYSMEFVGSYEPHPNYEDEYLVRDPWEGAECFFHAMPEVDDWWEQRDNVLMWLNQNDPDKPGYKYRF